MLRSGWSKFAKIAGLTLLICVGYGLYATLSWHSTALENEAAQRSEIHRENAEDRIKWVCGSSITNPDCITEARQTQRENEREEQDLAAQKVTAWWTKIMGVAALIGMGLSAIGVWLVKTTFDETRKANDISQNAMIADNRAWIRLEFSGDALWMYRDEITMDIIIHPKNIGHSVALDVRCWGELYIGNTGNMMNERFFPRMSPQFYQTQQAHNIWPGQEGAPIRRTAHGLSIRNVSVPTDTYRIFLILIASYRTIFDREGDPPKISELIQEITKPDGSAFDVKIDSALLAVHSNGIDVGFKHSDIGSGRVT